jgi:hypothetical protein
MSRLEEIKQMYGGRHREKGVINGVMASDIYWLIHVAELAKRASENCTWRASIKPLCKYCQKILRAFD